MSEKGNIDPTLRVLGGQARYQLMQLIVVSVGSFGASYQLLDNIFIGRAVTGQTCAAPDNSSTTSGDVQDVEWNATYVTYGQCEITVSKDNLSGDAQQFSCPFGYDYGYGKELSFRTEFDLVCDRKLLGGLAQSFVIMGQGIGAVLSSMVSDRYGRKRTLVASQLGLMVVGVAIGVAPSYAVLAVFKFLVGCFQQGVVTGMATIGIELFPMENRSMQALVGSVLWGMGSSSMALFAYLLRDYTWRYLQFTLSAASLPICLLQLWYLDESLRWLVANGRKEEAVRVLERAARVNRKDLSAVLRTLQDSEAGHERADHTVPRMSSPSSQHHPSNSHVNPVFLISCKELVSATDTPEEGTTDKDQMDKVKAKDRKEETSSPDAVLVAMETTLEQKKAKKLTVLDIFRHKRLFQNAMVTWLAWFTCAFSFFALYMMSTSLHGNRFINYFLTALMELPPGILMYFLVDRVGRKTSSRVFYALSGIGLLSSGIFRIFEGSSVLATLSVVAAMLGMFGASGMFGSVFFFTPELFPTNMRNQALGVASFAGRLGGMLAPFMTELSEIAIWAPGAIIGSLCFLVVILFRFIPETKGRELPHTIEDIKAW